MYNSSHGALADFGEWLLQRFGIETRSARVFARECGELINEMGGVDGGGTLHIFAHSQGGEITNNMSMHLDQDYRKMMNVRTFGSPRQIAESTFGDATNFASSKDAIPNLSYLSLSFWREKTKTIILPSNKIYGTDHSWDNDTYQNAITNQLKKVNKLITENQL